MQLSTHPLFGREPDISFLRAFVDRAVEDGIALLLTGDAGVGKSALLNLVANEARRDGMRVLRAAGAQFEASLSFAGLNQLLQPVLTVLAELDEIDRQALRTALGLVRPGQRRGARLRRTPGRRDQSRRHRVDAIRRAQSA